MGRQIPNLRRWIGPLEQGGFQIGGWCRCLARLSMAEGQQMHQAHPSGQRLGNAGTESELLRARDGQDREAPVQALQSLGGLAWNHFSRLATLMQIGNWISNLWISNLSIPTRTLGL